MKKKTLSIIIFLIFIGFSIFLFRYLNISKYFNLNYLLAKREYYISLRFLKYIYILGMYLVTSFIYVPIAPLSIFAGIVFGFFTGSIMAYIGSVLNIILSFIWARYIFKPFFAKLKEKIRILEKITKQLSINGKRFIFYARLFFLTPYNSLNIVCGISDIKFKDYCIASAGGSFLQAFFYSFVGSRLHLFADKSKITKQGIILSLVIILFFSIIGHIKTRLQKKITNNNRAQKKYAQAVRSTSSIDN